MIDEIAWQRNKLRLLLTACCSLDEKIRLPHKELYCHPPTVGCGMRHNETAWQRKNVVLLTLCLWAMGLVRL